MPDHNCSNSHCLHGLTSNRGDDYGTLDYVEVDPTGRYGRYKEVLGKGAFKTVYRAFDQEEGIEVAWNQVQVQDVVQTEEDVDRLYSEVHLLKTLKHKNIMKFYHSWVDRDANTINFITEVFTSGTLRQYRKRHRHVNIKAVKNWSRQILRGLLYLHSHDPPIIHRDLKCDNILINGNQGEVKIGDLGLATILQHAHAAHSVIGTPEYMAPELYEEEYTELVDIYSFGMCILEMVTSEYPYSECSNAAQIYKKVISGKKPEALKKVQDPETYQFIEKCLATVSRRLPARELLMDPFLQCDGVQDQLQPFTHIGRMLWKANDLEELHGKSATVHISYKLKETLPSFLEESNDYFLSAPDEFESGEAADNNSCKPLAPILSREERARSVDFRVNGKLKEDDAVYLRLRIADPEGQVRNVHFPFDVESDTALCVASEMVAELDLTDQDVTKIAEMIDAAILALVPEWKPGVAIDEACDGEGLVDPVIGNAFDDDHLGIISNFDPLSSLVSDSPFEEMSRSLAVENAPQRVDGTMYGRFEEVTYHCHRTDFLTGVSDEQCTVSSDTSDTVREQAVWDSTDGSSSPDSQVMKRTLPREDAIVPVFQECSNSEKDDSVFSDVVDSARRDEQSTYIYKTWEGVVWQAPCVDTTSSPMRPHNSCRQDITMECSQDDILYDDMQDELAADELVRLALKQEEELRELQRKHEEAVAELKNRFQQQKSLKLSAAASVDSHNMQST